MNTQTSSYAINQTLAQAAGRAMVLQFNCLPQEKKVRGGVAVFCLLEDGTRLVACVKRGTLKLSGSWKRQHYRRVDFRSLFSALQAESQRFSFRYQRQVRTARIEFDREFELGVSDLELMVALDLLEKQIRKIRDLPHLSLETRQSLAPSQLLVA